MRTQTPILLTRLTHSRCLIKTCWINEWIEWDGIPPRAPTYVLGAGSPYFSSLYTDYVFSFHIRLWLAWGWCWSMIWLISPSQIGAMPCALLVVDTEFNFFNQNVFYKSLLILRRWFFPPKSYSFFSEKNGCDIPLPRYWKYCTKSVSTSMHFIVLPNWWFQPILKTHHFWGEGNLACVAIPASLF